MAQPVTRTIKPDSKSRHRKMSAGAEKGRLVIARRLAIGRQLRAVLHKIDTLKSSYLTLAPGHDALDEQIALLRRQAKRLRALFASDSPSKKPSTKKSSKKRKRPR